MEYIYKIKKYMKKENDIVIYKSKDGKISLDINFNKETVWLTQEQISVLFDVDRTVITKHISNVFKANEIDKESNVQKMHIANSDKPVNFYNLDIILAVGYRVSAKKGIEFRKWASNVLKDYVIKGYSINKNRLRENGLKEFDESILFIKNVIRNKELTSNEANGLLNVILKYSHTWSTLQKYDDDSLVDGGKTKANKFKLNYELAIGYINELRINLINKKEASTLFGKERNKNALDGIVECLYQTFDNSELYPTIEEKASYLLYFIIKDHPFIDGNKRIGAFLFILFLNFNNSLFGKNGEEKIDNNALTAITLLIAESNPRNKDLMIKLILNLIIDK